MNTEQFARLARQSQNGDRRALARLLRFAHTPVSFQCRKLLRNDVAADAMTRQILASVPGLLKHLQNPDDFETWICRITASRCMQALAQAEAAPSEEEPKEPIVSAGEDMDELRTALLVQQLVDALPEEPRICLLLYSCAGLKLSGISQLTGFPAQQVLEYLNQAQKTINLQLRSYHRRGVHFAAIPALSSLVRIAMQHSRSPKAAAAMVREILPRKPKASRPRISRKMMAAMLTAAALLAALLVAIFILESRSA